MHCANKRAHLSQQKSPSHGCPGVPERGCVWVGWTASRPPPATSSSRRGDARSVTVDGHTKTVTRGGRGGQRRPGRLAITGGAASLTGRDKRERKVTEHRIRNPTPPCPHTTSASGGEEGERAPSSPNPPPFTIPKEPHCPHIHRVCRAQPSLPRVSSLCHSRAHSPPPPPSTAFSPKSTLPSLPPLQPLRDASAARRGGHPHPAP